MPAKFADEPDEEEEEAALQDIDILLAQSRPRHVGEGLVSGIGYIVAGAVGAAGIAVLSPQVGSAAGYEKSGVAGGIAGGLVGTVVGAGSAASVALGGTFSGVYQLMRGIGNTPASLVEPRRGKW